VPGPISCRSRRARITTPDLDAVASLGWFVYSRRDLVPGDDRSVTVSPWPSDSSRNGGQAIAPFDRLNFVQLANDHQMHPSSC